MSAATPKKTETRKRPAVLLAEFDKPEAVMHAAEKVRDAGYEQWDCHSPYPVHGMDAAMGLGNSNVGWFTFSLGFTGFTCGMLMIWFAVAGGLRSITP